MPLALLSCVTRTLEAEQSVVLPVCSTYGDVIPGHVLADRIATYIHIFNLYWYVR